MQSDNCLSQGDKDTGIMLYGLYQSATGADLQALKMDTVSNNIANAGTASFKRDLAIFAVQQQQAEQDGRLHDVPGPLQGHPGPAMVAETFTDFSQGPLKETGGRFDLALLGPGFLRVTDGEQEFLTRRGNFSLNADSELVQADNGFHVLDTDGNPIVIPPGMELAIDEAGTVSFFDPVTNIHVPATQLDLVQPNNLRNLQKVGDSLYLAAEGFEPAGPELRVRQGFVEQSGVSAVKEMLAMIETSRLFEANMTLIQHQDHTLGQLLQGLSK